MRILITAAVLTFAMTTASFAVDEALSRLEQLDPRKGEVVNLRFFARLTTAETAAALGVSVGTVERDWRFVRAWLQRELAA